MTRLLIAGATGLVGGHALAQALADDRVTRVVAPTRKALAPHPKLVNPIVATPATLPSDTDWWQVNGAIGALGTTRAQAGSAAAFRAIDYDYALAIARHARNGGATRFALTSAVGANPHSFVFYNRVKGELEQALRGLDFASLTIARPGLLGGNRTENRPLERISSFILNAIQPILPRSARISPAATVAALLLEAAITGAPGVHIISSAEIADAAAKGIG